MIRILFTCLLLFFCAGAKASEVVECNNCISPALAARSHGDGLIIVVDFAKKAIFGFEVEHDREFHRVYVTPTAVPENIKQTFLFHMSALSSGVTINISPGDPNNSFMFGSAYDGFDAYQIVISATLRSKLEVDIAHAYSHANTGNSQWDNLATSVTSVALAWLSKSGITSANITITWKDGSKTNFIMDSGSTNRAKYAPGQSYDKSGNRIADSAAGDPSSGSTFAGIYIFQDSQTLLEWLDMARMNGVQITGPRVTEQKVMTCTWDGRTLKCDY